MQWMSSSRKTQPHLDSPPFCSGAKTATRVFTGFNSRQILSQQRYKSTEDKEPLIKRFQKLKPPIYSDPIDSPSRWWKNIYTHMKKMGWEFWRGSKQLYFNTKAHWSLARKPLETRTRKENLLIRRNAQDLQVLIPFFIIWRVPIIGDPLLLWVISRNPGILPSTYRFAKNVPLEEKAEINLIKKEKIQAPIIEIPPEIRNKIGFPQSEAGGAQDVVSSRSVWEAREELKSIFKLDELAKPHVTRLCHAFDLNTIGPNFWLKRALRDHFKFINGDDFLIQQEGIDSLTFDELQEACFHRGLSITRLKTETELKDQLLSWIELSKDRELPLPTSIFLHLNTNRDVILK